MQHKEILVDGRKITIFDNGDVISVYGKKLIPNDSGKGYKYVSIGKYKSPKRNYYIHRLVAECFIPNPLNLPEVNHKDGNRANNNSINLEWVTRLDNIRDYVGKGRGNWDKNKRVRQFDLSGVFIKEWGSPKEVGGFYGCTPELIGQAATRSNTNCTTALGYLWQYKYDSGFKLKAVSSRTLKIINKFKTTI